MPSSGIGAQSPAEVIAQTRRWIERAVIGLDLCPFAKLPYARGTIRYHVSDARDVPTLSAHLRSELTHLIASDCAEVETTLLIHPHVLGSFLDYNDFLAEADAVLDDLQLDGTIQIASFHPDYRFADAGCDAIENFTNRSPYPMLHLLRETSVERAVTSGIDVATIPARNIDTLRRLGSDGWDQLWADESK